MQKIIAAIYGEDSVGILQDYINSLSDDEKFAIADRIVDVISLSCTRKQVIVSDEDAIAVFKNTCERMGEIAPSSIGRLQKELEELLGAPMESTNYAKESEE
jgi:hypothetical protein